MNFNSVSFLVHDTTNTLTVIAEENARLSTDAVEFYVDWFELDYWHGFKAVSGALEFSSNTEPEANGIVRYRVENLRTDEIDVYKIYNGSIAAKLENGRISRTSSRDFEITFEDVVTQPSSYFALDNRAYQSVTRIVRAKPATLRDPANQADYIVISHRNFIESIQPLVEFRRSQGHSVIVVDMTTCMNSSITASLARLPSNTFYATPIQVGNNRLLPMSYSLAMRITIIREQLSNSGDLPTNPLDFLPSMSQQSTDGHR